MKTAKEGFEDMLGIKKPITNLNELEPYLGGPKQTHLTHRTKNPLSTSTNKDRKRKKAKRVARKNGRKR